MDKHRYKRPAEALDDVVDDIRYFVAHVAVYVRALAKWLVASGIIGVLCGLIGTAFHKGVEIATEFRLANSWVLLTLPVAGLAVVGVYRLLRVEGLTTDTVIDQVRTGEGLSLRLLPAIFVSTIVTHLAGGSAGREGAALQMGGTVGLGVGRALHLDERDLRTATMAGMAAFFAALFGTPVAATIFALAVISVGAIYHVAFVPCLIASLASFGISLQLGVMPTHYAIGLPNVTPFTVVRVALLACLCGMLSAIFCEALHRTERVAHTHIANPWLRAALGGALLLLLTWALGTYDYNGAGVGVIRQAVEEGTAVPWAFALKIIFTSITLAAGFKGGEVVPCFFIGATFGCVVGPLLGLPAGFAAAVGLVAVFCGAVNCPIASVVLSVELFGGEGMLLFAVACGFAFVMSGYYGLYFSQRILYDKLKATYIDARANAYHESDN
ncbi:MAG: chloride channel protein [Atopobiaceae bacterium]|nr:chloride channel protein [Atopobiaceae bacterium]